MLRWVPRVGSPACLCFARIAALRLPAVRRASLRFLRSALPTEGSETTGPLRFLGNPHMCMPCSATPVSFARLGRRDASLHLPALSWPSALTKASALTNPLARGNYFEAQSHGLHIRCLRFAATVARYFFTATQNSLPAGDLPWPGGLGTRRVSSRGFSFYIASSSSRLGLTHGRSNSNRSPRARIKSRFAARARPTLGRRHRSK